MRDPSAAREYVFGEVKALFAGLAIANARIARAESRAPAERARPSDWRAALLDRA